MNDLAETKTKKNKEAAKWHFLRRLMSASGTSLHSLRRNSLVAIRLTTDKFGFWVV
jgi:hypothetical protein